MFRKSPGTLKSIATIQRQATRRADAIAGDPQSSTAEATKRRRIEQDHAMIVAGNECDYDVLDGGGIPEPQHSTNDYPPPLDPPPRVMGHDQRWPPSAEGILQEFVTLYKHSLEEQRQRDEKLLLALQRISQMTSAICKAVEQGRIHSNSTDS
ncbi:hypothetical protein V1509DRAFT_615463 [Lipomyces kononenkoae]